MKCSSLKRLMTHSQVAAQGSRLPPVSVPGRRWKAKQAKPLLVQDISGLKSALAWVEQHQTRILKLDQSCTLVS